MGININVLESLFTGYSTTVECTEASIRHAFSRIILEHLDSHNMTQRQLCEAVGVDPARLSDILSNDNDYKISTISKFLHGLKINNVYIDTQEYRDKK